MNQHTNQHPSQRDRLLALFKARSNGWIPLPEVMAAGGAQYNARIFDLRGLGYVIENRAEGDRSWFRLVVKTPAPPPVEQTPTPPTPDSVDTLFPDMPERHFDAN